MRLFVVIFFFKQKTAYEMRISDWSSDVCSSDLAKDAGERNLANQRLSVDRVSVADVVCVRTHHADEPARPYAKARAKASRAVAGRATVWLWPVRHPSPSPLSNTLNDNFTCDGAQGAPTRGTAARTPNTTVRPEHGRGGKE